ncbi:MAG TPA: PQQ-binding-like beta-propeller repeat protein [Gaiellaceae bacterium]|nr:PQQ-binding-like beta-propeller repeat protein [Gaiellaceae bacterium]
MRRIGVVLLLATVAAGCGSRDAERPPTARPPTTTAQEPRRVHPAPSSTRVVVTVVDGDTGRRVRGASVRVGRLADRANRKGNAELHLRRRAPLVVSVAARGYAPRSVRMPFQRRRRVVVRVYQPGLQWPMYGATPVRDQAHPAIGVRPPFRLVWSRGLGALVEFPAVVSDGVAYVGNNRGSVYAVSMRNGAVVWRHDVRRGKMAASPAVVGDALVVHGMDGVVRVLDRATGRLRFAVRVGSPIESSPLVRDRIDYFGAWNGNVYALDLRTRRFRWVHRGGAKITSSAALAGRTLFIGDYAGRLLALAPGSGRLRWSRAVNGRIYGTPAVWGNRVFVPSSDGGSLTAFTTGGRYLWRIHTGSYVYSSPAVWAGRVFFGSYNGLLYCVSAWSGRVGWTVQTGGAVSGAPAVVAGVVYAGSFSHRILGVDARTGRVLLRFPHGEYVPVSGSGGRLLLHGYSRLYAVEPV